MLTCKDCKYWDGDPDQDGLCRRSAPTMITKDEGFAIWPLTNPDEWCGELVMRPVATLRDLQLQKGPTP